MAAIICNEKKQLSASLAHPLKLTALLYLKDALLHERYEDCGEMIAIAKEFGADHVDVGRILSDGARLLRRTALLDA